MMGHNVPDHDGPQCEPLHNMQQMYITAEKWKNDVAEKQKDEDHLER